MLFNIIFVRLVYWSFLKLVVFRGKFIYYLFVLIKYIIEEEELIWIVISVVFFGVRLRRVCVVVYREKIEFK